MKFLLDTSVISQYKKDLPNPSVDAWLDRTPSADLYLSDITIAELSYGVQLMPSGKRRTGITEWLETKIPAQFHERLLPFNTACATIYGRLLASAEKRGHNPGVLDAMIAATAIANGMTVATLNRKDFERLGAEVVQF